MTDPYRTAAVNGAKQHVLEAIENARELQQTVLKQIKQRNILSPYSSDLEMVEKLNKTLTVACEHERALLRQAGGDGVMLGWRRKFNVLNDQKVERQWN